MGKKNIIIKADDFKYPSIKEREIAQKDYPQIDFFGFEYKSEIEAILNEKMTLEEASRNANLYWWDICLRNRLGKLHDTYTYVSTNYNRGFSDDYLKCSQYEFVNRLLFDYYAEIFYYYFFSTRDIIAQILRLHFCLDIDENKLYFNYNFIKKINNPDIEDVLMIFFKAINVASDYRNGFAHRFTVNQPDYRSVIIKNNDKKYLAAGSGKFIPSEKIFENINNSLNSLSSFMIELKKYIKPSR